MRPAVIGLPLAAALLTVVLACPVTAAETFDRRWTYVSETSAVIYWQLGEIGSAALSWVEYGKSDSLGLRTEKTIKPRWSHLHGLKGLDPRSTYFYRMAAIDTLTGLRLESAISSFTLATHPEAVRIPQDVPGPPYDLDRPNTLYILTGDITTAGDAFRIAADGVTLDLDGHTVTFGDNTPDQVFGVRFINQGRGTLCNGRIVQGTLSGDYSCAIRSDSRPFPTEIFGITTDVHLRCAYPVNFQSQAADCEIHHNHFYSRVTEIESRHYPGNALLRMYITGGNIHIHDNLFSEGCHRGLDLEDYGPNVEVDHNDIQHHQQYVNGYALIPSPGSNVHHNKITSTGRGVHLIQAGISLHDNYLDLKGHQDLDDLPQGSRPFQVNLIELHGIKFEGSAVKNCKVYDNFVRIVQRLPHDSEGKGAPEDKLDNGVYVRSTATSLDANYLVDITQNWEADRWREYSLKYAPGLPASRIGSNTSNSLLSILQPASPGEYTIYMVWNYVPPTPLNIACYDPNALNEVYGNTFIGLTERTDIWHGDYGHTGNWATGIMFISMDQGPAASGNYSSYVHDNKFISNDLFLNGDSEVNMTVRLENNSFQLVSVPYLTTRNSRFRGVGAALENSVLSGGNILSMNPPSRSRDINGDGKVSVTDALSFLLLARSKPENTRLDWNLDGKFDQTDIILLLKDLISADRGAALAAKKADERVEGRGGLRTREETAGLLRLGLDGL